MVRQLIKVCVLKKKRNHPDSLPFPEVDLQYMLQQCYNASVETRNRKETVSCDNKAISLYRWFPPGYTTL